MSEPLTKEQRFHNYRRQNESVGRTRLTVRQERQLRRTSRKAQKNASA